MSAHRAKAAAVDASRSRVHDRLRPAVREQPGETTAQTAHHRSTSSCGAVTNDAVNTATQAAAPATTAAQQHTWRGLELVGTARHGESSRPASRSQPKAQR